MKVLLNRNYGAHFTRCKELMALKEKLKIDEWEDFVIDQRVADYIEKTLKPKEVDEERTIFKIMCGASRPLEGKIALEEVDTSMPWMIKSYDDYESVVYLTKLENNQYIDESDCIYGY